jgi:hypothetical protein
MSRWRSRFLDFHRENTHVYRRLVELAREWRTVRPGKQSMELLFALLRWDEVIDTTGDPYRLNSMFQSYYARLIMHREPDLAGAFDTRAAEADILGYTINPQQQALWEDAASDGGWLQEAMRILDEEERGE